MTPKQLANVLKELSSNKAKYEEYLAYKKSELTKEFVDIAYQSYVHPLVGCRLCDYYQKQLNVKRSLLGENSTVAIVNNKHD